MEGTGGGSGSSTGVQAAHKGVKAGALALLFFALAYCLFGAGLGQWSHSQPFQVNLANFALFAGFIVVAGAIERFLEPVSAIIPPYGQRKAEVADRALITYCIALFVGIAVSSIFGLYFLEAIGLRVGETVGSGDSAQIVLNTGGDKIVRGFDIFVTALIITGGTKPLHDTISLIEKKKEAVNA